MASTTPRGPSHTLFQLRIELDEVDPAVWRRLLIPGQVKLAKLHLMLQAAMGWSDSHLHAFAIGELRFGLQADDFEDYDEDEIDEASLTVKSALASADHFTYEYDFGDGWEHRITVEATLPEPAPMKFAVCLEGQNACPPDDVGGPGGYENFLAALADPGHAEHQDYKRWIGGAFDPAEFDLGLVNILLQAIR
ncbi:MAG TPA: plasmid pRiA4b ORF-3 family protein [Acidimicrobiales bacterium]